MDGVTLDDTLLYDVELLDHYRVRVRPRLAGKELSPMSTSPDTDRTREILREYQ